MKLNEWESNPYVVSVATKRSCLMQSKALNVSVSSAPLILPLSLYLRPLSLSQPSHEGNTALENILSKYFYFL